MSLKASAPVPPLRERSHHCAASIDSHAQRACSYRQRIAPSPSLPASANASRSSWRGNLRWSPDGKAFQYAITREGAGNIWEQPISGGAPRQITRFPPGDDIRAFAWSPDGKQLAVTRGHVNSNVVVISDFR